MYKNRIIRIFLSFLMICSLYSFISFGMSEGRFLVSSEDNYNIERVYKYVYEDYHFAKNEWKYIADEWYYFGEDNKSLQNTWAEIDGKWYYFDQWSIMLHDTTTPDGYYVGTDGVWDGAPAQ